VRAMEVAGGGPAARAGLDVGDIVIAFDGEAVHGIDALHRRLDEASIGKPARLSVIRRDRRIELTIVPVELT